MKMLHRVFMTLVVLGAATAAQARPLIQVGSGDCNSPLLSQSIGLHFVIDPVKKCFSFANDVGIVTAITLKSDVYMPSLRLMPGGVLKALKVSPKGRLVRLSGGAVIGPELVIRMDAFTQPIGFTLRSYKVGRRTPTE